MDGVGLGGSMEQLAIVGSSCMEFVIARSLSICSVMYPCLVDEAAGSGDARMAASVCPSLYAERIDRAMMIDILFTGN